MRNRTRFFRLTTSVAITALLAGTVSPAVAQPVPPGPGVSADQAAQADPPERVGRLARATGTVSFHAQDDTQWSAASVNYPVSTGDAFWTEPTAQADLEVSASRIALSGGTEFDVNTLDANGLQATTGQGTVYLHLSDLAPGESWSVQTPRGLVRLAGAGRYEIAAGTTETPTTVTVLDGAAAIEGPGVSMQVRPGETATVSGSDVFQGNAGPAVRDPFLTGQLERERPPRPPAVAPPPQVAAMPGGDDLSAYGNWATAPEYGPVWYPPVTAGWVPYREGHWAFIPPWGWTWVDDAPWGFAPFHYGRWITIGGRWGWTPGYPAVGYRPVYAPALVTFIGIGAGVAVGVGFGAALASRSVGWVPLGPHEPYRPWYHASDRYFRQVNITHVTNVTTINRNVTINNFANRRAATFVPADAMTSSRPVTRAVQHLSPQQLSAARPVIGHQPLQPTRTTAGVTPAVARQMNLAPLVGGPPARPGAPGPSIRATAASPAGRPAGTPAGRPPLATVHGTSAAPVGEPNRQLQQHAAPALVAPGIHNRPSAPGVVPGPAFVPHGGAPTTVGEPRRQAPNQPAVAPPHAGPLPTVQGPPAQHYMQSTSQPGTHPAAPAQAPHPGSPVVQAVPHDNRAPQIAHPAVQAAPPPHFNPPPAQASREAAPAAMPPHNPPPQTVHPPTPAVQAAAPPQFHPAPQVTHPVAPPAPHSNPPPQPVHAVAPQFHPPPQVERPAPPPAPHYNPPPQPVRAAPPQFHAAPPPAQHAPPPQHEPQQHEKRPGDK